VCGVDVNNKFVDVNGLPSFDWVATSWLGALAISVHIPEALGWGVPRLLTSSAAACRTGRSQPRSTSGCRDV
jgi:hypothetical protein